jgi:lipid A 3-O-deacylase
MKLIVVLSLTLVAVGLSPVAFGSEMPLDQRDQWRFEFDNDIVDSGSDDQFTAGWSLQNHSRAAQSWGEVTQTRLSRWIADHVPGLSPQSGKWLKRGIGIGQIIQTPQDIETTELVVDDVPYAGALLFLNSWYAFDDDVLNGFQITTGLVGPESFAEDVQTVAHVDLGWGEEPMGWDNQLKNEPILNLSYMRSRMRGRLGCRDAWSADWATSSGAGVGNLMTYGYLSLEGRIGWNKPRGFAHIPDPPGRNVMVDPTLGVLGDSPSIYLSAIIRGNYIPYTVLLDGNTFTDSHSVDYDVLAGQAMLGLHVSWQTFSIHWTYYHVPGFVDVGSDSNSSWSNLSFEYKF